jgi:AAHS family 3-hydroxyphenylpropionic acid transporter
MPTLYSEIARDIPMTYTQWGTIWGIAYVAMMIFSLMGGMAADWLGIRLVVGLATISMGVFGIGRAFSYNFNQLFSMMFFMGIGYAFLLPNLPKSLGQWFPNNEMGFSNGILTAGVCIGSGSALQLSGVYLSPLFGGWRNVMWLYGVLSIVLGIIWIVLIRERRTGIHHAEPFSFRKAFSSVICVRDQWFLMASRFCIFGALIGVIGFLPELLVSKGMQKSLADLSSSLIYYTNIIGVIAIPVISDRCGLRKIFIWPFALLSAFFIASLSIFGGISSLVVCGVIGLLVGFLPLLFALSMEMEGIDYRYFGTSLGLVAALGNLGGFVAPAWGGKLIDSTGKESVAFIFWGILMLMGGLFILPMKETGFKGKVFPSEKRDAVESRV